MSKVLLDTCTFIWLTAAPTRLGAHATSAIDDPATELYLSDASVWELCLKWQTGKIQLPAPPRLWLEEQLGIWHLKSLAIERIHMFRVSELPDHHRDPFDRLLVAQAIEGGMKIASPDVNIRSYPVAVIW